MAYEEQKFENLLGMEGFSDGLLNNHFKLYAGYVVNANKVADALLAMSKEGKASTPEYAELKRRFGWEFNGMRLHEFYFSNLSKGGNAVDSKSALRKKIAEDFGDYESWENDFKSTGAMRGIGWVVLAYDPQGKRLFNLWINEHNLGHLAGAVPLLVMDVFEHAFMLDYGTDKVSYITAVFKNIDWGVVNERFDSC
tara:strand:+ start:520 stop:1107 length:588 start_codon:yes stop_codon:yes gene_type:complete